MLTMQTALDELLGLLNFSESDMGGAIRIEGQDPVFASRHHIGEATAVLLATLGTEIAAVWKMRSGQGQDVLGNVRKAVCQLAAIYYAKQQGCQAPYEDDGMVQTTDFFRCGDGRWVYIVCSIPHLRNKACAVLNCQPTRQEFVIHCARWNALELEEAIQAAGGACCMVRTRDEWLNSEQGRRVQAEPLIRIDKIAESDPIPFPLDAGSPLSGLRVIDNTHIYAGPFCGRIAADAGADVLHLTPLRYPDPAVMLRDTSPGKRSAWCELNSPLMAEKFWELLKGAFMCGSTAT